MTKKKGGWPIISIEDMLSSGGLFPSSGLDQDLIVGMDTSDSVSPVRGKCSRCGKRRMVISIERPGSDKKELFCRPCGDNLFNPGGEGL